MESQLSVPSPRNVGILLWEKAWDFIRRAFTVIFTATILIWFLQTFDLRFNVVSDGADSILALVGRWIAPVFQPLGFGDWRAVTALISGFTAKEAVISTLGVLLGVGVDQLGPALGTLFTPLAAGVPDLHPAVYPCVWRRVATIRRELGSKLQTLGGCGDAVRGSLAGRRDFLPAGEAPVSPWTASLAGAFGVGIIFALRSIRRNRGCCGDCTRCQADAGRMRQHKAAARRAGNSLPTLKESFLCISQGIDPAGGSGRSPRWMPTRLSYMAWDTGPILPSFRIMDRSR